MPTRMLARIGGVVLATFAFGAVAQNQGSQQQQQQDQQRQQQPQAANQGQSGQQQERASQDKGPVVVLMPVAIYPRGEELANGCWVRMYEGENFDGTMLTVMGPADLPDVEEEVPIIGIESAIVGPKATVTAYDGENYEDQSATLQSGQEYADLEGQLELFEDVESMTVSC